MRRGWAKRAGIFLLERHHYSYGAIDAATSGRGAPKVELCRGALEVSRRDESAFPAQRESTFSEINPIYQCTEWECLRGKRSCGGLTPGHGVVSVADTFPNVVNHP